MWTLPPPLPGPPRGRPQCFVPLPYIASFLNQFFIIFFLCICLHQVLFEIIYSAYGPMAAPNDFLSRLWMTT